MKTYRLRLEPDPEIPRLQMLAVDIVEVPIVDVLQRGIHPVWTFEDPATLQEAFVERLNAVDVKLPHLEQLDYCGNIDALTQARYYQGKSPFQQLVEHLNHGVRFVTGLTYVDLLNMAKDQLRRKWNRQTAYRLLSASHRDFDAMRSLVKAKDKRVKISGYADFDHYDLSEILSLDDLPTTSRSSSARGFRSSTSVPPPSFRGWSTNKADCGWQNASPTSRWSTHRRWSTCAIASEPPPICWTEFDRQ